MKRLFTTLLLVLCFTSCGAQQTKKAPVYRTVGIVSVVPDAGISIINTNNSKISYKVPTGDLNDQWEYVFWLEVVDCGDCSVRTAVIVKKAITTNQAQKNQALCAEELSDREIKKG